MENYEISFVRSARKELEDLNDSSIAKIFSNIDILALNPRPRGCEKIKGERNLWRIRVGDYRVVYSIDNKNKLIEILIVRHRREAYR